MDKPLENTTTGMKAVVSRNNLDKMLNSKAVSKSDSPGACFCSGKSGRLVFSCADWLVEA